MRKSMKRNIQIEALAQIPLEKQQIELVERKCLGHPDSIADGIAESISRALCNEYLEEFGAVLHHNTDQGEVVSRRILPSVWRRQDYPAHLYPDRRSCNKKVQQRFYPHRCDRC